MEMSVECVKKTIDMLINARWVVPIIPKNTVLDQRERFSLTQPFFSTQTFN